MEIDFNKTKHNFTVFIQTFKASEGFYNHCNSDNGLCEYLQLSMLYELVYNAIQYPNNQKTDRRRKILELSFIHGLNQTAIHDVWVTLWE